MLIVQHSSTPYLDNGVTGAVKKASLSHGRLGRLDGKLHLEWPSNYCPRAFELRSPVSKQKSVNEAQKCSKAQFFFIFLRATPHDSQEDDGKKAIPKL